MPRRSPIFAKSPMGWRPEQPGRHGRPHFLTVLWAVWSACIPAELCGMVKVKMFSSVGTERSPAMEMPDIDSKAFYEVIDHEGARAFMRKTRYQRMSFEGRRKQRKKRPILPICNAGSSIASRSVRGRPGWSMLAWDSLLRQRHQSCLCLSHGQISGGETTPGPSRNLTAVATCLSVPISTSPKSPESRIPKGSLLGSSASGSHCAAWSKPPRENPSVGQTCGFGRTKAQRCLPLISCWP